MTDDNVLARLVKNATEEIWIRLREFNGYRGIDIRVFYDAGRDDLRPTKKGIWIPIELLASVIEALEEAREPDRAGQTEDEEAFDV